MTRSRRNPSRLHGGEIETRTTRRDIAFVDRADIKAYVGPPALQARYEILRSCVQELVRAGVLACSLDHDQILLPNYSTLKEKLHSSQTAEHQGSLHLSKLLLEGAEACQGLSGRALRKLPFLTHAAFTNPYSCDPRSFMCTLIETARRELSEKQG